MKTHIFWLIAILIAIGLTYILVPRPYQVHHHANFAVYIDGQMRDFSSDAYMEEVSRCNISEGVLPEDRIHLHDNKGNLVHVHMAAATWGDLLANLSWGVGASYLVDPYGQMHGTTGTGKLYFYIDGKQVDNPANIAVDSTDRLLVWYGSGTAGEIQQKWETLVPNDADEYNQKADPASCSANTYGWLTPIAEPIMRWLEVGHDHK